MANLQQFMDEQIQSAFSRANCPDKDFVCNQGELWLFRWQYDKPMGSFEHYLSKLLEQADVCNLQRLSLGYPDHVTAYIGYSTCAGYWKAMQARNIKV